MGRRILSLHLPRLASDLVLRQPGGGPLAIIARQGRGDVLLCPGAAVEGVLGRAPV